MIQIRRGAERGHFKNEWLDSYHSFSFGEYYDPDNMGISTLRVINDDVIEPAMGFPTHPHNNMEIVTYVLEGVLEHKDSMGNGSQIRPGDVQRMSAGSGLTHSEFNASQTEKTRLLQIWLLPNKRNVTPGYAQEFVEKESKLGQLKLLVSPEGQDGSISIHSDSFMYAGIFEEGQSTTYAPTKNRLMYLHVARGEINVNGNHLHAGDAVTVKDEAINLEGIDGEVLLFDLPADVGN